MAKKIFIWEEDAEKAIKNLVKQAKKAVLAMTRPVSSCTSCLMCRPKSHDDNCPVTKLRAAIKDVSRISKWR